MTFKEDCCKLKYLHEVLQTEVINILNYSTMTLIRLHKLLLTSEIPRSGLVNISLYKIYFHKSWLLYWEISLIKNKGTRQNIFNYVL